MPKRPILVSRARYAHLVFLAWDRRDAALERLREEARARGETVLREVPRDPQWGDPIGGRIPRRITLRQRTLQRRREDACPHAHIDGGGVNYYGEGQDWDCRDCGAACPEQCGARVIGGAS